MSPIDDLTYDVITVLHSKAKALDAYEKYLNDAEADDDEELKELFDAMRRQDEANVEVLKEVLVQRLADDLGYEEDEAEDEDEEPLDADDELEAGEQRDARDVRDVQEGDVGDRPPTGAVDAVPGVPRRGDSPPRQR